MFKWLTVMFISCLWQTLFAVAKVNSSTEMLNFILCSPRNVISLRSLEQLPPSHLPVCPPKFSLLPFSNFGNNFVENFCKTPFKFLCVFHPRCWPVSHLSVRFIGMYQLFCIYFAKLCYLFPHKHSDQTIIKVNILKHLGDSTSNGCLYTRQSAARLSS